MNYNYKIDSMKFFSAIAVVLIHLTAFLVYEEKATLGNYYFYRYFLDFAVPFFFAASGFFLATRLIGYIKQYAKKIFLIYVSFSLFYLVMDALFIFTDHLIKDTAFWSRLSERFKEFHNFSNFIKGSFGEFHFWYLAALFFSVLLLCMLIHFNVKPKTIFLISFIIYAISLSGLIDLRAISSQGGFPKGFFYLAMGYYLGNTTLHMKHTFKIFLLSAIVFGIFSITTKYSNPYFLASTIFFLIAYCIQHPGKPSFFSKLGQHSLQIYILHVFIYTAFYKILGYFDIYNFKYQPLNILLLIVLCVVLSILLYKPIEKFFVQPIQRLLDQVINIEGKTK